VILTKSFNDCLFGNIVYTGKIFLSIGFFIQLCVY
jgi:hypothetical protein